MEAGVGTQQLTPELDTDENLSLTSLFQPSLKQKILKEVLENLATSTLVLC